MKMKRPLLTLLVLILSMSTISTTYLLTTNRRYSPASSSIPTVSVSPKDIMRQVDIGQTFTVNITITNASDLYVWQAGMTFNATILEAISFAEGSFLKESGNTLWTPGTIDNTVGIIYYHASALAGNVTGASGNGTLGTITFKVKDYGNSTLQLTEVILLDSQLKSIDKTLIHGTVQVKIPGDVNGDRIVNILDLAALGKAYGSSPGSPNWNPQADINSDLIIDVLDLAILSKNYGKAV